MYIKILDHTLQSEDKHLLVRTIHQYDHNKIKISASKKYSS